jgi:threonylcarbamoyladenosine tRNA methylthiotransferase MtaB
VQNGCDHRCTFCIIPYGRGPSRSEPAGAVIDRVRALVEAGYQEVVLTGVDVTSYGDLAGDSLGLLVARILRHVPELPRLRLSSLDPVEIDPRLMELICHEPRLMPHLHLSLQAGDDLILKRMKRRHLRADAIRLVERVKAARPEVAIGADLIAGFPTESDAAFDNSLRIVEECDIVYGHIFPYSRRHPRRPHAASGAGGGEGPRPPPPRRLRRPPGALAGHSGGEHATGVDRAGWGDRSRGEFRADFSCPPPACGRG